MFIYAKRYVFSVKKAEDARLPVVGANVELARNH
jgi:hypothetical protein